jgi:hypothetical protein
MVFEAVPVGQPEQPQKIDRIALEDLVVDDVDAVIVGDEIARAGDLAAAAREGQEDAAEAGHILGLLLLQRGAEDAGEVAHRLGGQEVVLHEALDGRQAGMGRIAQPLGDLALDVEMQPLLGPPGEEMHVAAHGPEEILRLAELQILLAGEDALVDQFLAAAHAVVILADPEQRVQVAQAALAVLDVGFDEVAALAGLGVPIVALGQLRLHIFGGRVAHHLVVEAGDQFVEQRLVAPDEARLQDRGPDRHVAARQPDAFVDVAGGVADLQPQSHRM